MYQSKHALYAWRTRLFLPRPHHEGGTMTFLLNWTFLDNFCSIKGWCFKSPCSSEITAKDQSHSENDWDWEWLMTDNTALWVKLTNTNYCLKKDCPTKLHKNICNNVIVHHCGNVSKICQGVRLCLPLLTLLIFLLQYFLLAFFIAFTPNPRVCYQRM